MDRYNLNKGTIQWARNRARALRNAEVELGCALEILAKVPGLLTGAANLMNDHPESDVARSYADDVQKIVDDLSRWFWQFKKERNELQKGIAAYEKEEENELHS